MSFDIIIAAVAIIDEEHYFCKQMSFISTILKQFPLVDQFKTASTPSHHFSLTQTSNQTVWSRCGVARKYSSAFVISYLNAMESQAEMNTSWEFSTCLQGDNIIEMDKQTTGIMKFKQLEGWMKWCSENKG